MDKYERLITYAIVMLSIVLVTAIISWFAFREIPYEILSYSKWLFGALSALFGAGTCVVSCVGKIYNGKDDAE